MNPKQNKICICNLFFTFPVNSQDYICHFHHQLELKILWLVDASWLLFMFLWIGLFIFNKVLTLEPIAWVLLLAFGCDDEVIWINIIHRLQSECIDQRQLLFHYVHDHTWNLQLSISCAHLVEAVMHSIFKFIFCDNLSHKLFFIFTGSLRRHTSDFVNISFIQGSSIPPTNSQASQSLSWLLFKTLVILIIYVTFLLICVVSTLNLHIT